MQHRGQHFIKIGLLFIHQLFILCSLHKIMRVSDKNQRQSCHKNEYNV